MWWSWWTEPAPDEGEQSESTDEERERDRYIAQANSDVDEFRYLYKNITGEPIVSESSDEDFNMFEETFGMHFAKAEKDRPMSILDMVEDDTAKALQGSTLLPPNAKKTAVVPVEPAVIVKERDRRDGEDHDWDDMHEIATFSTPVGFDEYRYDLLGMWASVEQRHMEEEAWRAGEHRAIALQKQQMWTLSQARQKDKKEVEALVRGTAKIMLESEEEVIGRNVPPLKAVERTVYHQRELSGKDRYEIAYWKKVDAAQQRLIVGARDSIEKDSSHLLQSHYGVSTPKGSHTDLSISTSNSCTVLDFDVHGYEEEQEQEPQEDNVETFLEDMEDLSLVVQLETELSDLRLHQKEYEVKRNLELHLAELRHTHT